MGVSSVGGAVCVKFSVLAAVVTLLLMNWICDDGACGDSGSVVVACEEADCIEMRCSLATRAR